VFKIRTRSFLGRIAQRQTGTPNAFENPLGKRDPYQLYSTPNDGKGRKLTTPFSLGFPNEPTDGSSSGLGGDKFDRVNPSIPHPYAENGDPESPFSDNNPSKDERPGRSEYGMGSVKNFVHPDSPLSTSYDVFSPSAARDRNPRGPQGDVGEKARALGRN